MKTSEFEKKRKSMQKVLVEKFQIGKLIPGVDTKPDKIDAKFMGKLAKHYDKSINGLYKILSDWAKAKKLK